MRYVVTGDWHIGNKPVCRTDVDWDATIRKHLQALSDYADKYNADLLICGDVFDTPTVAPKYVNMVMEFIFEVRKKHQVYYCFGNHDMSYHCTENISNSSVGALDLIRNNKGVSAFDYGTLPTEPTDTEEVVLVHTFAVANELQRVPRECKTAEELCKLFPKAKCVCIGDNHKAWHTFVGKQIVVNAGTLIQRTATEALSDCGFFSVDTDKEEVSYIDLTELSKDCIDLTYLDNIKAREETKDTYANFVSELKQGMAEKYDFLETLKAYAEENKEKIGRNIYDCLLQTIGYCKRSM